jgi:hypothetical protein
LPHIALKSSVESMTIVLTPAFSVKTIACRALSSSQSPKAFPPVKSTSLTSGRVASVAASLSDGS